MVKRKNNQENKQQKIMEVFFNFPSQGFHIREISRLTKIPVSTVSRIVKEILKENLLIIKRKTPILELQANLESKEFINSKKEFNISRIKNTGLLDFLVSHYNEPEAIVLFGSYSRGEDIERGDVDLMIITHKKINPNLEKFEKLIHRKIHLLEMASSEIKKELLNNVINGVILYGYLKIK